MYKNFEVSREDVQRNLSLISERHATFPAAIPLNAPTSLLMYSSWTAFSADIPLSFSELKHLKQGSCFYHSHVPSARHLL